jgi:hypothetical protein
MAAFSRLKIINEDVCNIPWFVENLPNYGVGSLYIITERNRNFLR